MTVRRIPAAREVLLDGAGQPERQEQLEERFFASLRMPNGTYKTTAAGRLSEFDELIEQHLVPGDSFVALDVGIASGVTTVELVEYLRQAGHRLRMIGIDRYLHARLVQIGPGVEILLTSADEPLQLRVGRYVRPLPQGPRAWKRRALQWAMDWVAGLATRLPSRSTEVDLVTARAARDTGIELMEQDIQDPVPGWKGRFRLIRAANVLNLTYFEVPQLEQMLAHLVSHLEEGGLLALCRTAEGSGTHHGSIYRKTGRTLQLVATIGEGSEVATLLPEVGTGSG